MPKYTAVDHDDLPSSRRYMVPGARATNVSRSTLATHERFSLWLCRSVLQPRSEILFEAEHGPWGLFVIAGRIDVQGHGPATACTTGGAVIVDAGVELRMASALGALVCHYGPCNRSGAAQHPTVTVVPPTGVASRVTDEDVEVVTFAEACDEAGIEMLTVQRRSGAGRFGRPHSHSQDEIIHILAGELEMGAYRYGPATSLLIPAGTHYAVAGAPPLRFVNYRCRGSVQTFYDD